VCSCELEVDAWFHCWSFGEYAEYPSSVEWMVMIGIFMSRARLKEWPEAISDSLGFC
jgi:hypothetical protein